MKSKYFAFKHEYRNAQRENQTTKQKGVKTLYLFPAYIYILKLSQTTSFKLELMYYLQ